MATRFSVVECNGSTQSSDKEIELYLKAESGYMYLKARDRNTKADLPAPYILSFQQSGGKLSINRHGGLDLSLFLLTTDGTAKIHVV